MSKPKRERSLAENEAKAVARMLRVSPQKLNLVAQMIRGKEAATALTDLAFSRRRIAVEVRKVLQAAIANAWDTVEQLLASDDTGFGERMRSVGAPRLAAFGSAVRDHLERL